MTSVFGALNGNLLAMPRVAYAMARGGRYRLRLERPYGGGVTGAQSVEWISGRPRERRGSNHEPRRSLYGLVSLRVKSTWWGGRRGRAFTLRRLHMGAAAAAAVLPSTAGR